MSTPVINNVNVMNSGTLYFFCGKMGAGKSTYARSLACEQSAVLLSEDDWLAALYPQQINTLADYIELSQRLRGPIKPLVQSMLSAGTTVVMDFPANTRGQRAWLRDISVSIGAEHQMIYIDVSDEVCLQHIAQRREREPQRAQTDTEQMFAQVTQYFEPPSADEGLTVVEIRSDE